MFKLPNAVVKYRQTLWSVYRSHAVRRWSLIAASVIVVFGLLGFFGVPPLLRYLAGHQLSASLHRPVTIGRIAFNPYTLRLEADQLRIGEPAGAPAQAEFLSVGKLVVRTSWSALFRLKPVISEVYLEAPVLHLVRSAPQRFNFSDLADQPAQPAPAGKPEKPALFSVSNIHVEQGRIDFDDEVLHSHHTIDQWRLGIPFIANLPAQTDIFVQPLLQARIDGSALTVTGRTKPFSNTLESTLEIDLDQFDLTRLLPYVPYAFPDGAPAQLLQGHLSSRLGIDFSRTAGQVAMKLSGRLDLAGVQVADGQGAPLFGARLIHLDASDVQPLRGIVHLAALQVDQPAVTITRDAQGGLNLLQPTAGKAARERAAVPASASAASSAAATPAPAPAPFDLAIRQLALSGGSVHVQDRSVAPAGRLDVLDLDLKLSDFSTVSAAPASYSLSTRLEQGGSLAGEGMFSLPAHRLSGKFALSQLALPALQPWLNGQFNGQLGTGKLAGDASMQADWSAASPLVHVAPAVVTLSDLSVLPKAGGAPVLAMRQMQAKLTQFDLASRHVDVASLSVDGLALSANRDKQGMLDVLELAPAHGAKASEAPRTAPVSASVPATATAPVAATAQTAPAWHYTLGELNLNEAALSLNDLATHPAVALRLAPLHIKVTRISDVFSQPWPVEADATFNKTGSFSVRGDVTLAPLKLALHVNAKNLDLAAFEPYFGGRLNASVSSALFSAAGELGAARAGEAWQAAYDGDAALDNVRMIDRVTADLFAGWRKLSLTRIKARYDAHGPDFEAGDVTLNSFYARVILDQNGRINLSNLVTTPAAPTTSLTRTDAGAASAGASAAAARAASETAAADAATRRAVAGAAPGPASEASAAAAQASSAPPVNLRFGQFVLERGRINYTDNFIKPNFTANLVNIAGKVGTFGTRSTQAAPVDIKGSVDGRGPISISGTVNPLIDKPALDLTASARSIELTGFTPYATKYAGYPIVEGRLNVDLHYKLADNLLTANNHLLIDQLTFGDRVENTTATHLPVKLAISLLKNSRGQIDVNVPVSGSLSDPQFSLGGLIWGAVVNLLEKAVTAPFTLLANAFGGGAVNLEYVEFAPGSAALSADAQKKLEVLAKAMADKPAIKLEMFGRADPAQDGPALRRLYLERMVRQQKFKESVGHGASVSINDVKVAPDEYDKYLKRAYGAADFKKPRNLIGLDKSVPPEEMTAMMEENAPVGDVALRDLAQNRVSAVHQFLEGKVPDERLSDRSPHLDAHGIADQGATTRVDFALK